MTKKDMAEMAFRIAEEMKSLAKKSESNWFRLGSNRWYERPMSYDEAWENEE